MTPQHPYNPNAEVQHHAHVKIPVLPHEARTAGAGDEDNKGKALEKDGVAIGNIIHEDDLRAGGARGGAEAGAGTGDDLNFEAQSDHSFAASSSHYAYGPEQDASIYYNQPFESKTRTLSVGGHGQHLHKQEEIPRRRRLSHGEKSTKPRKFLIDVDETMKLVLEQEDTNGDFQISITDSGPKVLSLGTAQSNGFKSFDIRGTYMLSNLLQELALARSYGRKHIVLDESRLTENPVDRLSRLIRNSFWNSLTRRLDAETLEDICRDPKNRAEAGGELIMRIYVPGEEKEMLEYYREVKKEKENHRPTGGGKPMKLHVEVLPPAKEITATYVRKLNDKPGILALAMRKDEKGKLKGIPFVVPGARFNELYNWDSYFISLGLLVDDKVDMAKGIAEHFAFEIKHYGKILNGNRSYYLCRSQPPFLTDLSLQVYNNLDPLNRTENDVWLRRAIKAAIKEYHTVWMSLPRLDPVSGLSRYRPDGQGIPPETEASHFTHILQPYADKEGISINEFCEAYNEGRIKCEELDEYFLHDRAVRESGHDTSYRLEKICANLATVDLNSLLYKYEVDIATAIRDIFGDEIDLDEEFDLSPFPYGSETPIDERALRANYGDPSKFPCWTPQQPGATSWEKKISSKAKTQTSAEWFARAERRRYLMDKYLWHEGKGIYFDYDTAKHKQSLYESVTCLWPMWSGCASNHQAQKLMTYALPKFEVMGGLVSGTEESRGRVGLDRPNRQWDYPCAWSPHQVMAWIGLERYGYLEDAQRLAYRWLYMLTASFVDFNGMVPEKLDAVALSHHVGAEYGNQGVDFRAVNTTGFGWTNASYQIGLTFINSHMRRAIGALTSPEIFFKSPRGPEVQMVVPDSQAPVTSSDGKTNISAN